MTEKAKLNHEMFSYAVQGLVKKVLNEDMSDSSTYRSTLLAAAVIKAFGEVLADPMRQVASEDTAAARENYRHYASERRTKVMMVVKTIRSWLDGYDIVFSQSEVRLDTPQDGSAEHLVVCVTSLLPPKEERAPR